jgi:F-type H+-transporting ATPase subunit a
MHPIEQFEISNLKKLGDLGAYHFHFTNSAAYMLICLALIAGITRSTSSSPTRCANRRARRE